MSHDRRGSSHCKRHLRRNRPAPALTAPGSKWSEGNLGPQELPRQETPTAGCPISRAFCAREVGSLRSYACDGRQPARLSYSEVDFEWRSACSAAIKTWLGARL